MFLKYDTQKEIYAWFFLHNIYDISLQNQKKISLAVYNIESCRYTSIIVDYIY